MFLSSALEQASLCSVDKWWLGTCIFLLGFCCGFIWDVYLHVAFIGFSTHITQSKYYGLRSCAHQKKYLSLFHFFLSGMEVGRKIWQNVTLFHQSLLPDSGSCMIRGFFMASFWIVRSLQLTPTKDIHRSFKRTVKILILMPRQLYNQKEGLSQSTANFHKHIWIKWLCKYVSYHHLFSTTQKTALFFFPQTF